MNKSLFIGSLIILLFSSKKSYAEEDLDKLIPALIKIESNYDLNAVGDNGRSKGILQIHEIVVKDVNRIYGTEFTVSDCFIFNKSIDICKKYLIYWGKYYQKKENKKPSLEIYSRIWNGGPKGYKKKSTLKYWKKVKKILKRKIK